MSRIRKNLIIPCKLPLCLTKLHEALISARPYRRTCSHREAVAELRRYAGTQFDPELLEMFVKMLEALLPELARTATPTV